jgi:hypothetical protein
MKKLSSAENEGFIRILLKMEDVGSNELLFLQSKGGQGDAGARSDFACLLLFISSPGSD